LRVLDSTIEKMGTWLRTECIVVLASSPARHCSGTMPLLAHLHQFHGHHSSVIACRPPKIMARCLVEK
jgi:hypothetical protein